MPIPTDGYDHGKPGLACSTLEALAELDSTDREIVTLTYWDGLSAEQVGHVVGLRAVAVRKRLQRARERLAGVLGASEGEDGARPVRERSQGGGQPVTAH